jgi:hypothetical protein
LAALTIAPVEAVVMFPLVMLRLLFMVSLGVVAV